MVAEDPLCLSIVEQLQDTPRPNYLQAICLDVTSIQPGALGTRQCIYYVVSWKSSPISYPQSFVYSISRHPNGLLIPNQPEELLARGRDLFLAPSSLVTLQLLTSLSSHQCSNNNRIRNYYVMPWSSLVVPLRGGSLSMPLTSTRHPGYDLDRYK